MPFKFGQSTEDGEHQPAMWCGCVAPGITQRQKGGASRSDGCEGVEQIASGSRQPVELGND